MVGCRTPSPFRKPSIPARRMLRALSAVVCEIGLCLVEPGAKPAPTDDLRKQRFDLDRIQNGAFEAKAEIDVVEPIADQCG